MLREQAPCTEVDQDAKRAALMRYSPSPKSKVAERSPSGRRAPPRPERAVADQEPRLALSAA